MKRIALIAALLILPACAFSARYPWDKQQDRTEVSQPKATPAPTAFPTPPPAATPTPTPPLCVSSDGITVVACREVVR